MHPLLMDEYQQPWKQFRCQDTLLTRLSDAYQYKSRYAMDLLQLKDMTPLIHDEAV